MPGRYASTVAAPGMQSQIPIIQQMVVNPYLQIDTATVYLLFEIQPFRRGFQEIRFFTALARVTPPQITQDFRRITDRLANGA